MGNEERTIEDDFEKIYAIIDRLRYTKGVRMIVDDVWDNVVNLLEDNEYVSVIKEELEIDLDTLPPSIKRAIGELLIKSIF